MRCKEDQPERFARAVKASCGAVCSYPECGCTGSPFEIEKAINAWEEPLEWDNRERW